MVALWIVTRFPTGRGTYRSGFIETNTLNAGAATPRHVTRLQPRSCRCEVPTIHTTVRVILRVMVRVIVRVIVRVNMTSS